MTALSDLRVVAAAHLYRMKDSDDPRAVPTIVSAPPPARHHNLFALCPDRPDESGFLLSNGRFADRVDAADIALAAGQVERLQWGPELYSEDLW